MREGDRAEALDAGDCVGGVEGGFVEVHVQDGSGGERGQVEVTERVEEVRRKGEGTRRG